MQLEVIVKLPWENDTAVSDMGQIAVKFGITNNENLQNSRTQIEASWIYPLKSNKHSSQMKISQKLDEVVY